MTTLHDLTQSMLRELGTALDGVDPAEADTLRDEIQQARRVFIAGRGRTGLIMRGFAMRLMHLGLAAYVVDDVTTPAIAPGDLLIVGSGSGRTESLVGAAARAQSLGARVALVTAAAESPIGERAACVLNISAPSPKNASPGAPTSIQPMGSLFEQALGLLLDALIVQLMGEMGVDAEAMFARHANLE
jgi:6-phospho-3-hexuloisomerase